MSLQTIPANGAELCVETFGDPSDPAILLIGGGGASMDWWDAEFCARLAASGRLVIRYDLRDTGQSTTYPRGNPGYSFPDLSTDAIGVLDGLGIAKGNIVGISMGGTIALGAVLRYPDRVSTLTLMSTSPAGPGSPANGLPPVAPRLRKHWANPVPDPDWNDRDAYIDYLAADTAVYAGTVSLDEQSQRELIGRAFDRSIDPGAAGNHGVLKGGTDVRPRLGEIKAPTLVIHGTVDPLFPLAHGEAFVAELPQATLLPLEGVGHEAPPPATWDVVVPALVEHTGGSR
ncbi:alpha/beta fold hydrolase [Tenggerimyces flavus]|uniref:Alpha/beta fold hydrolase n=1 Tax=Tenggerimyces flavus TaxID=1708749 RepID=A0ABV7YFE4_9ACTN|nr:alpha/beta hydrolase [Tenggerimyces flavus]MBM7788125.1 pimeloyl-ACP methyl ester carboxylesterase [Tenggerimyces flavus]